MRKHHACSVVAALLLAAGLGTGPALAQTGAPLPFVGAAVLVESAPEGIAVNPLSRRIYVANSGSQSVSVIDAYTHTVVATVRVGNTPRRLVVNPTTNRVYVANQGSGTVSVIDGETQTLESVITVGANPGAIAVNPRTNRVYVATCADAAGRVVVINGETLAVEGALQTSSCPRELILNPTTNRLTIVGPDGTLALIDATTDAVSDAVRPGDLGTVTGSAVNPTTNRIYLAQQDRDAVAVLDGASGNVLATVAIPSPDAVAVNPTNNRVYVTSAAGGTVTVVDGANNAILTTVPVLGRAVGVATNPVTGRIYVTNQDRNAVAVLGLDFIPPVVQTTLSPEPNSAGWNKTDVTVSLKGVDNTNGSGVKTLEFVATGAQPLPPAAIDGDSASIKITQDGPTILVFRATDGEGNAGIERSRVVFIDKTPPAFQIVGDLDRWHAGDASIPVIVTDFGSGLLRSEDATINLAATLPAGEEKADVETNSRTVSDVAGNETKIGPLKGIKIDRKPPTIQFLVPTQRVFTLRQPVAGEATATDGGSGLDSLVTEGLLNGRLDTSTIGPKSFVVKAKDKVGNEATQSLSYTVVYGIHVLNNPDAPVRQGRNVAVRLQLRDAAGVNLSSLNIPLTAVRIDLARPHGPTVATLGRPFFFQRTASGGEYSFTVSTQGLAPGRYALTFTAGKEPFLYTVPFAVR